MKRRSAPLYGSMGLMAREGLFSLLLLTVTPDAGPVSCRIDPMCFLIARKAPTPGF